MALGGFADFLRWTWSARGVSTVPCIARLAPSPGHRYPDCFGALPRREVQDVRGRRRSQDAQKIRVKHDRIALPPLFYSILNEANVHTCGTGSLNGAGWWRSPPQRQSRRPPMPRGSPPTTLSLLPLLGGTPRCGPSCEPPGFPWMVAVGFDPVMSSTAQRSLAAAASPLAALR